MDWYTTNFLRFLNKFCSNILTKIILRNLLTVERKWSRIKDQDWCNLKFNFYFQGLTKIDLKNEEVVSKWFQGYLFLECTYAMRNERNLNLTLILIERSISPDRRHRFSSSHFRLARITLTSIMMIKIKFCITSSSYEMRSRTTMLITRVYLTMNWMENIYCTFVL